MKIKVTMLFVLAGFLGAAAPDMAHAKTKAKVLTQNEPAGRPQRGDSRSLQQQIEEAGRAAKKAAQDVRFELAFGGI